MTTSADRHLAAVLGSPVAHSLSPLLHRAAYAALGHTHRTYAAREVQEDGLATVLAACEEEGGWAGLSLTMPLKQVVMALVVDLDDTAREVGACNTVLWHADGTRSGANTDVHGIRAAVLEAMGQPPVTADGQLSGAVAHILGGGATAASAVVALHRSGIRKPVVHVRDATRAGAVLAAAGRCGSDVTLQPWPSRREDAEELLTADVVVSTVPAGAADRVADLLLPGLVGARTAGTLLDVAYEPWPSRLATAWSAAGGPVAPGSLMLLHQAAEQVRLMTGRPAPLSAMRVALAGVRSEINASA